MFAETKTRLPNMVEEANSGFPHFNVLDRFEIQNGAIKEIHTFLEGHHPDLLSRFQGRCIDNGWSPGGKETHIIERRIMAAHIINK
jgi:hypothetical protein